ncbi:hypothetical protein F2Q69_00028221 [Brassica cretica]|uniref:Uncharacterized protein n=1 Tax=Brassica cretica TaxID=69181 RepID=A0A8S9RZD7_BRACR|nr:hypothetical protein F2Q69_00028221 [Brassica cretica]
MVYPSQSFQVLAGVSSFVTSTSLFGSTYNSSKISLNMVELKVFSRNKREKSKETQCNSRPAEINATFGDSFMTCSSRTKPIICFSSQPTLNRLNIVADHAVLLILFALIRS